jgi:uracil-DNA glycosylase
VQREILSLGPNGLTSRIVPCEQHMMPRALGRPVGRIAAQTILVTDAPMAQLRVKLHRFGEANTPLFFTCHPAYLLCTPCNKR